MIDKTIKDSNRLILNNKKGESKINNKNAK